MPLRVVTSGAEGNKVDENRASLDVDETASLEQRLTPEEDAELRRLHWFSKVGILSSAKRERMIELRLRDRRKQIRAPREFGETEQAPPENPAAIGSSSESDNYKERLRGS
jgi:hypothetical protein